MTAKQLTGFQAPDGSDYMTVTDGGGNLAILVPLGQTTKSASIPVTIASDQGTIGAGTSQYPSGATVIAVTATGTTAATVATLPGAVGKTTYISGFTITADATALTTGTATVSGLIGPTTFSYVQTVSAATSGASVLNLGFNPAIPASAPNTAIVVTSAAAGTAGNTVVNAWGYQL